MSSELTTAVCGFTIERLRAFCKIADSGSIVLAAKGDPTRQSQYSRQVKELEEFFGAKLIERAGNSIRLTERGKRLAAVTSSYFRVVEDMRASASKEEEVRVGAGESVFRWLLMPRLAELQGLASGVRLELFTKSTIQSVESVKSGQLDLAIVRKEAADESLSVLPCGSLDYTFVVPRKMLAGKDSNGNKLPGRIPFALHAGDGVLAKGILSMAEKLKVHLDIRLRAESSNLLVSAIENADLAAVIPSKAVAGLPKGRFVNIKTAEVKTLTRELAIIYSPHAAELRDSIRRIAPRISNLLEPDQSHVNGDNGGIRPKNVVPNWQI